MENNMGKTKNRAIELLQKVMDYQYGRGAYDFSKLSDCKRENAAFDAWQNISEEIKEILNENRKG
jgi:hypothetical protein